MPIETACPTCQSQFRLPDNLAGQQVQCTNCHAVFTAPQVNAPAPQATAPQATAPQATAPQATAPQTTAPQPTASSDGSFMSVFDGVSEPQSPSYGGGYTSQPQSSYPTNYNEGYAGSESSENSKLPMVIIGLVGLGLLLCLTVGVSAWYMLSGGDDNTEEVASNESSSNSSNSSPDKERDKPTSRERKEINESDKDLQAKKEKAARLAKEREEKEAAAKEKRRIENEQREIERAARNAARALERKNAQADREYRPREGESFEEWVQRWSQKNVYNSGKFFLKLESMDVQPDQLEMVSSTLCSYLKQHETAHFKEVSAAMMKWRTPETDQAIMDCVGNENFGSIVRGSLMERLSEIGSAESAERLALALDQYAYNARKHLISMGPIAEPAVVPYLDHENRSVRKEVYRILSEIGTRESIKPLERNIRLEESSIYKSYAQTALDTIQQRHPEENDESNDN